MVAIVFSDYKSPVRATYNAIAWSPELGLFAAVSSGTVGSVNTRVITSPDGVTWTARATPAGVLYNDIIWSASLGLFVAVGTKSGDGSNTITTSSNGVTWSSATHSDQYLQLKGIAWSASLGVFIAVGRDLGPDGLGTKFVIKKSTNGTTWSTLGLSAATSNNPELDGVIWCESLNRFVAWGADSSGLAIFLSGTGASHISWGTRIASPIVSADALHFIAWSQELGLLVAGGTILSGASYVSTSTNGTTWTNRSVADPSGGKLTIKAMAWSPGAQLFLGVGYSYQTGIPYGLLSTDYIKSSDGITWTAGASPLDVEIYGVTWSDELGVFAAVGSNQYADLDNIFIADTPILKDITRGIIIESVPYRDITRSIEIKMARAASVLRAIVISAVNVINIRRDIVINANLFGTPAESINWTAGVTIGGVDYSSRLTGRIAIRRAVNAATLADVSIVPVSGAINPADFDGKQIVITYQDQRGAAQLFKGVVIKPSINMADKTLNLTCSDLLQETLSKLTTAQIDALIPHHRSNAIYQAPEDNYDYALECLKSAEGDFFLGVDNEVLYQSWTDTDPVIFTDNNVWFGDVVPTFADRHSLVNTVNIELDYRHLIGWHRVHQLDWRIPHTYAAWVVVYFSSLPTRAMIESAIPASCVLASKSYTNPPPAGLYSYFGSPAYFAGAIPQDAFAYIANIEAAERWLQTVTHKIKLSVTAPASVTNYGEIPRALNYSLASDESGITFDKIDDNRLFGTAAGFDNSGEVTVSDKLPPADEDNLYIDWRVKTYRKKLFGQKNTDAIASGALNCLLREAARTVLETHQNVTVSFSTPINPLLTLKSNADIDAAGVTATGRIKALEHRLNLDDGSAITAIELVPVSGAINQTLTTPVILDSAPVSVGGTSPLLELHLKDPLDATPDNEDWRGYIGNYVTQTAYQERFVVEVPEVADELRDDLLVEQSNVFTLNVTLDKIGLTV